MTGRDFKEAQEQILHEIKTFYDEKKLIPFIGAGFSKNVSQFPDWNKFITKLQKKLRNEVDMNIKLKKVFSKNNIQATEAFVYLIGKKRTPKANPTIEDLKKSGYAELVGMLKDEFAPVKYNSDPSWDLHRKLIKMFDTIYTTNWDDVLEKTYVAIENIDESYRPIINYDNFIHFLNEAERKQIIKFHGDYRDEKSLIATESDYLYRIVSRSFLDTKLMNDLLHNSFLFMGFSFDDIFIKYLLFQLYILRGKNSNISKGDEPKIYMVSKDDHDECKDAYFSSQAISVYYLFGENKSRPSNSEIRNKHLHLLARLHGGNKNGIRMVRQ